VTGALTTSIRHRHGQPCRVRRPASTADRRGRHRPGHRSFVVVVQCRRVDVVGPGAVHAVAPRRVWKWRRRKGLEMADAGGLSRTRSTTVHAVGGRMSLCSSTASRRGPERAGRLLLRFHQGRIVMYTAYFISRD